jgi:hypothetical protein
MGCQCQRLFLAESRQTCQLKGFSRFMHTGSSSWGGLALGLVDLATEIERHRESIAYLIENIGFLANARRQRLRLEAWRSPKRSMRRPRLGRPIGPPAAPSRPGPARRAQRSNRGSSPRRQTRVPSASSSSPRKSPRAARRAGARLKRADASGAQGTTPERGNATGTRA